MRTSAHHKLKHEPGRFQSLDYDAVRFPWSLLAALQPACAQMLLRIPHTHMHAQRA
jgi:hypothetical protein